MARLHLICMFCFVFSLRGKSCSVIPESSSSLSLRLCVVRTCRYSSHPAKQLIGLPNLASVHNDSTGHKEKLLFADNDLHRLAMGVGHTWLV